MIEHQFEKWILVLKSLGSIVLALMVAEQKLEGAWPVIYVALFKCLITFHIGNHVVTTWQGSTISFPLGSYFNSFKSVGKHLSENRTFVGWEICKCCVSVTFSLVLSVHHGEGDRLLRHPGSETQCQLR